MLLSEYLKSQNWELVDIHMKNDLYVGNTCWVLLSGFVVYKNDESIRIASIFPENEGTFSELYELVDKHPLDLEIVVDDSGDISKARWVNAIFENEPIGFSGGKFFYD